MALFIDRRQSETIKGILILLIVFGHNHILCPNTVAGGLMEYLYQFHVLGFFILPFFYQNDATISKERICNVIVRNWIPYLWICMVCWLAFSISKHEFSFGWSHIMAFFNGTQTPIRQNFGFIFPWFLPVYCSFSIMLMAAKKYRYLLVLFTLMGIATFFMSWIDFFRLKNTMPFGIGLAINYFASGAIAFYANKLSAVNKYIGAILFFVLSVCWWCAIPVGHLLELMPTSFFLLLLCLIPYIDIHFLRVVGRYSLGIYLFHLFIINLLERILPHEIIWGWVIFAISLLGALMIAYLINQTVRLRMLLFPKSWNELRSIVK